MVKSNLADQSHKDKPRSVPPLRRVRAEALVQRIMSDLAPPCSLMLDHDFYEDIMTWFEWSRSTVNQALNDVELLGLAKLTVTHSDAGGVWIEVKIGDEDGEGETFECPAA